MVLSMQVQELEESVSSLGMEKRTLSERLDEKTTQCQKVKLIDLSVGGIFDAFMLTLMVVYIVTSAVEDREG